MNNTVLADTALVRAVAYLERGLVRHEWSAGERLPSMLDLAKAAAVSMTTMVAAVKIVRQQERLCVRRGKGIFVAAPAAYQPVVDDHTKWQRVRRRVARIPHTLVWLADRVEVRQPWSLRRYQGLVESIVGNGLPAAAVIDAVCLADQTVAAKADRENGTAAARGQSLQMLNKEISQHLGLLVNNPLLSQDDGFEASANNITSYNFDIPAIARLAVSFIVNPRHEAFTESGPVMECEGHIVERNSSRKTA